MGRDRHHVLGSHVTGHPSHHAKPSFLHHTLGYQPLTTQTNKPESWVQRSFQCSGLPHMMVVLHGLPRARSRPRAPTMTAPSLDT